MIARMARRLLLHSAMSHISRVALLAILVHCSGSESAVGPADTETPSKNNPPSPPDGTTPPTPTEPDGGVAPPGQNPANVIFILTDDLSWNLVKYMPHVVEMQKKGVTFENYFVTDSLCCPSRSSILTGRFPHGTGVFTNSGDDGGYATFKSKGNETRTFATSLLAADYATAFYGKYLNGYNPTLEGKVPGWSEWALSASGYKEFNYTLNESGKPKSYTDKPAEYLTDVIAKMGVDFVTKNAKTKNFVIELATFAPHAPYTPAPRHENLFPDLKLPRGGAYGDRPDAAAPDWLKAIPPLDATDKDKLDANFRKRAQSVQAVDDLIGKLQDAVAAAGQAQNTYFVFSSDNGFHMGEHSLRGGKQTAFDTDIRVPLIVTGPGVPAGRVASEIAQNIDLCATFSELGHAEPPAAQMGRSLVPLFHGQPVPDWRNVALVEHHGEVSDPDDPDLPDAFSANPPGYGALRTASTVNVEYKTGEIEYYDHATDPNELHNAKATLTADRKKVLHDALTAVRGCKDSATCWAAQHLP
jgi:N-acetylglucosamine-6-sulfatase